MYASKTAKAQDGPMMTNLQGRCPLTPLPLGPLKSWAKVQDRISATEQDDRDFPISNHHHILI